MRKIRILKNRHYPFPFIPLPFPKWVKKEIISTESKTIMFTDSCIYDLKNNDQYDVNKLFGFSIGYHHKTSFRFGWRPKIENKTIEIIAYEYHNGMRQESKVIGEINLNEWYFFRIVYLPKIQRTYYTINKTLMKTIDDVIEYGNDFSLKKTFGLGYKLGFYFGGNEKAPHNIIIYIK